MNNITSHSEKAHPILRIPIPVTGPKVTSMLWGTLDKSIITGHENGELTQWDLRVSMVVLRHIVTIHFMFMFYI
jgi:translation initiation factor 3 subunit I